MAYPAPVRPSRPIGVALLAILVILAGLVLVLLSLLAILLGLAVLAAGGGSLVLILAGIAFVLSAFLLLAGLGLWKLRPWAWWLSVIVLVLSLLAQLAGVSIQNWRDMTTSQIVALGLPILILLYLFAVRRHFRSPAYVAR